ncbi:TonB-dependent receptor plug domain-containing protein [Pyxidicoccus xibeiensis]|uniref:TonB-dependent receptor plug domain-containing protein n=1 Tax=Pyxidicoccus xibeiensis TaxID=2906759 RepID=UPI0020A781F6|nr:TonB-dependent receptor [Pyxidicoccus xibeiensis]MCP3139016.1 TonB-dependent receptor [Pyxidicoccus xibeiensis]
MSWRWCLLVLACALPVAAWGGAPPEPEGGEAVEAVADAGVAAVDVAAGGAMASVDAVADAGVAPVDAAADGAMASAEADTRRGLAVDAGSDESAVARTVVTASRARERLGDTAVATEVITRADILASGARDAAELLAAHPGLEVVQTFSGAALQVQGLGSEYVLVLVDGERVAGRVAGSVDLSRLSLEEVEQVEIVKGPSSVLYGSDAVAGVVNLITRKARRPLGGEVRLSYGSLKRLEVDGTGEARGEGWGVRLSGGLQRRDAYDLDPADQGTTGSSLEGFDVSASGDLRRDSGPALEGTASYSRRTQRGVDLGVAGAIFDRASRDDSLSARLTPSWRLAGDATLRVDAAYAGFLRRYLRDQRRSSALDTVEDTREQQGRLGAQLDARAGEGHALVVGAELLGEWLQSDRLETGRGRRGRASVYAQDSWTLLTGLVLVPGARVDTDTQFGTAVTPRLAARVDPLRWLTLRGSFGWSYRAPGFQELLLDFENPTVGYSVHGNPELRPERSRGLSLSAEVRPSEASLLWASAFQHTLRDMIGVSLEQDGESQRFSYINVARARVRGGELGVRQRLPGRITAELGYTLTDGRSESSGRALEGQARHRLTAQATWRHRESGVEAWARGALVGHRPFYPDTDGDGEANPYRASPYVTVDARLGWRLREQLQLFVIGTNLLDAGNPNDLPIPPRTFQAGLSARL